MLFFFLVTYASLLSKPTLNLAMLHFPKSAIPVNSRASYKSLLFRQFSYITPKPATL